MGLGYYGRAFTLKDPNCYDIGCEFSGAARAGECTDAPGTLAWFEIVQLSQQKELNPMIITNTTGQVKILVFDRDQWVGYDDEETLEFKRNWAKEQCLKGTMIWSIDQGIEQYRRKGVQSNKYTDYNKGQAPNRIPVEEDKTGFYPPKPQKANQYGKPGLNRGVE